MSGVWDFAESSGRIQSENAHENAVADWQFGAWSEEYL
jgi:hypothetical protein